MAFVKVKIPRTSQPQDACGIDWGNPMTRGLRRALLGTAKHPRDLAENAPVTVGRNTYLNGVHIGQPGAALRSYNSPYTNGQEITFPAWENISQEASFVLFQHRVSGIINNDWLLTGGNGGGNQHFPWNGNVQAAPFWSGRWINTPPPNGKSFLDPHILSASVKNGSQRAFWDGELFASDSLVGGFTLNSTIQLIQDTLTDMAYYSAYFFDRALSDAEIKSISGNPWQIFEPEELTIWIPDEAVAGGAATVIPIGVQANSAIGTPTAIGAAIAALTGISATGSVGSPAATGGASIPGTASPSGVSASSAVGLPIAKGVAKALPTGVAATANTGGPVVKGAAKALPAGVQVTSAVGVPLAIGGSSIPATALPAGVAGLAYVGSPVATSQARAYPLGVQATGAVGSPVVTAGGSVVAQPMGVAASSSVGVPVARGAAAAYPLGLAGYWSVGQPVATGQSVVPATAYPAGVSATGYVGAPVAFEASDGKTFLNAWVPLALRDAYVPLKINQARVPLANNHATVPVRARDARLISQETP